MTCELAKELEDAGFRQTLPSEKGRVIHNQTVSPSVHYYEPILEELIEACGDEFGKLEKPERYWYAEVVPLCGTEWRLF
jgi:hypothetical protein